MPTIGPTLPPHLAKRKREEEDENSSPEPERSKTPDGSEKRRRIIGPAPPPAALDAQDEEDSTSDDDFGPALPTGDAAKVGPTGFSFLALANRPRRTTTTRRVLL
jgi:hypothetical protein